MEYFEVSVLRNAKRHFKNDILLNIVDVIRKIKEISELARREGLLAMEEYANESLSENVEMERFIKEGILLIVDGTEPSILKEVLSNQIAVEGLEKFESYLKFIIMNGMLMVQNGINPRFIEYFLLSYLPGEYISKAKGYLNEYSKKQTTESVKRYSSNWDNEKSRCIDNSFLKVFEDKIMNYNDRRILDFVSNVQTRELGNVLIYASKSVKERVSSLLTDEQKSDMGEWIPFYTEETFLVCLMHIIQAMMEFDKVLQDSAKRQTRISLELTEEEIKELFDED